MKQFVRGKPNPIGLKIFILADKVGIVYDFYLYQGKASLERTNAENVNLADNVVLKLCETVPPNTSMTFDRYFTSEPLIDNLLESKIYATGTLGKNYIP